MAVLLDGEVERILEDLDKKFGKDRSSLEKTLALMLENWYQQNQGLKTRFLLKLSNKKP